MALYQSIHTGLEIDQAVSAVSGLTSTVSGHTTQINEIEQDFVYLSGITSGNTQSINNLTQDLSDLNNTVTGHTNNSSVHHTFNEIKTDIGIDTLSGSTIQFLNEKGYFTEIPLAGNGNSANVYLTTQDSEETGYKLLSYALEAAEVNISRTFNNQTLLVQRYLFPAGVATTVLPAGTYEFNFWASSNKLNTSIVVEFFKRSITDVDTVLFTVESTTPITSTISNIKILTNQIAYTVLTTDRVGINVYFKSTFVNTTMLYIVGDGRSAYWKGTAQPRHSDTRDKNGEQSFQHIDNSVNTETTMASNDKLAFYSNTLSKFVTITIPNFLIWIKAQLDSYFQLKNIIVNNTSILTGDWVADTTYPSYGYKVVITINGVTSSMLAEVTLGHTESISGNYSPICVTGANSVTIYSKVNTGITIPTILIQK